MKLLYSGAQIQKSGSNLLVQLLVADLGQD
jgi:hypothetical protein